MFAFARVHATRQWVHGDLFPAKFSNKWIVGTTQNIRNFYRRAFDHTHYRRHNSPQPSRTYQIQRLGFPLSISSSSSLRNHSTCGLANMTSVLVTGSPDEYRLPLNVKPTHYDVTIRTDLDKLIFEGFVKISLDIKEATSTIVLNTAELELAKVSIYSNALKTTEAQSSIVIDKESQRVTLGFPTTLPAGSKAELRIGFGAPLTGKMTGYYRSAYEHEGKTKYYTLTQFEPTSARSAFPCWDEPLLKATYNVTLISRADTINLSNMPVISEEEYKPEGAKSDDISELMSSLTVADGKWKTTRFQTTPIMSSYLVGFANGHFEYLEKSVVMPVSKRTIPLRIYATANVIHQAQFALDVTESVLPLYEKIFDVEYPLPKLDTLVVSAMENWGLITGRTTALLLDPIRADIRAKKAVATTQSHEVAHMWFGNITTMEWWNNLYLKEGTPRIPLFPEWKVDSEFISNHLGAALSLDAKLSSHPIEVECPDANHINQIFDSLSYSKAASVLRMLSNYVGEDKFLKGVSIYLKKHLYGNTVTNDLWAGVGEATGMNIVELMDNWMSKMGFPVLTVTETDSGIHVRQDRFLETGYAQPKDNETIWNIPLSILSTGTDGKPTVNRSALLDKREGTFELDTSKPFKLNAGTVGVYRVLYTPDRLAKIASEAAKENSNFALTDRIGLVQDSMALSKAGLAKLSSALTLVDHLKHEKECILSSLVSIWWEHKDIVDKLNAFRRTLFVPLVEQLGYDYTDTDTTDTSLLRTCAITNAAAARDEGVVKELQGRFRHFMDTNDDARIPPDLQRVIFSVAVRHGGRAEYDAVQKIHDNPKTPTARISAILAMGASQDLELAKETLAFMKSKSRDQDVVSFFRGLSANFKTRRLVAQYFKDEYDVLFKRFEGNFTLKYLVETALDSFSTEKDYNETVEYFKDKNTSKYKFSLAQTLDSIRANTAYIERSSVDLKEWLEGR
ncbi:leucyl aminopeptidase [Infundibulicybe gibba]|nr:leucyl aminopeptidase [Infundibulicybe gibba]